MIRLIRRAFCRKASFDLVRNLDAVYLYAGDVPQNGKYNKFIGLSLTRADCQHIRHDVRKRLPLESDCVDVYQSEDVFEHIQRNELPRIIDEVYRVLKPGGVFRLSVPDYQCDILYERSEKSSQGEVVFDPGGGGRYYSNKVIDGGHVWFPTYVSVKDVLDKTKFKDIRFLHYYDDAGVSVTKQIDYSIGFVSRTPDHDYRVISPYRPMSLVVDCYK